MKKFIPLILIVFVALSFNPANAQWDFSRVGIQLDKITEKFYLIKQRDGAWVNTCALQGKDGLLLVDSGHGPVSQTLLDQMEMWVGPSVVKYVLNTHLHGDHVGANEFFGPKAIIISHDNVRTRLEVQPVLVIRDGTTLLERDGLPVVTYNDSISIFFNEEEIRMFHVPNSHTDGDSVVYFTSSNVACLGDLFQNKAFPLIDPDNGGNLKNYLKNVGELVDKFNADTVIIPGHGPKATLADFKEWHTNIVEAVNWVETEKNAGTSLADIIKTGLPEKYEKYDWRPRFITEENWLTEVFNLLENPN